MQLRFGELTFDSGRRELFRGASPVHLTPKAFQLLELLLARRPDAVSKEELQEALWPGVFVSESSLKVLVRDLRRAVGAGDTQAPRIRTVFGFGYAFAADVVEAPAATASPHRHALVWGTREMPLVAGENLIGRKAEAPVWVAHPSVSREHALVCVRGELAELEDLGSKNGTYRGLERVIGRVPLRNGDEVRVGEVRLVYAGPPSDAEGNTATAR